MTPSVSILAEPSIAVVDKVVDKRNTASWRRPISSTGTRRKARKSRPQFLSPAGRGGAGKTATGFAKVALFTIDEVFGGWGKAQDTHFKDGGIFDQIYGK